MKTYSPTLLLVLLLCTRGRALMAETINPELNRVIARSGLKK